MEKGDSKFNMGVDRIRWIAQISNQTGRTYHKMLQKPSRKKVKSTLNMLDTLLFELRHQIGDEEKAENIQEDIDEAISKVSKKDEYSSDEIKSIKDKIRTIRKKLGKVMKDEGIDIPREIDFDEDSAFTQGLN